MCDNSKLLCNFAQIFKEIEMRKRFIHILWAIFGTGILYGYAGLLCHLVWIDWLHARHRGSAESYQQIRHPGVFVPMARCWVHGT